MTKQEAINKLTAWHMSQVGYLEKASGNLNYLYDKTANSGTANYTKYGYEMHKIQPSNMDYPAAWCDAYYDNGFVNVFGVDITRKLLHDFDDYTVRSANLYKLAKQWYSTPQAGDQIFFIDSKGGICHTGYVYAVDNLYVYTVEGNTSGASGVVSNGGGVAKKKYTRGYAKIAGYGRPDYALAAKLMTEKEAPKHWAESFLNKLIQKGYITDKTSWNNYDSFVSRAQAVALIDKTTGGMWTSNEDDTSIHWSQPHVISLCGKKIIEDKSQWLMGLDTNITKALFLALIDKATGGTKAKYVDRVVDHFGRNNLDSLCDKGIITTPESWIDFESPLTKGLAMGLVCKAFIG